MRPPTMPPLPTEVARPLYEILPEVKTGATQSDIYASSHGYAMPEPKEPVNIQKNIDIAKGDAEKEDEKKKKDKKDKYKVKF